MNETFLIEKTNTVSTRFFAELLAGNRPACRDYVSTLLERGVSPENIYTVHFQGSLYRVGELWEQNRISVAKEHFSTAIIESLMSIVYPHILRTRKNSVGKTAIVSCTVNEWHQIGARMVADIMEGHGWDVYFLGANTPTDDLLALIQEKKPDALGLSISIYFNMGNLVRTVEKIKYDYPNLDVFVGGQAFRWCGSKPVKGLEKAEIMMSLESVKQTLCSGIA